jgi:hypothetical protein
MNALTACVLVALIGAIAFVAVAVITARARIGLLPAIAGRDLPNANSSNASDVTTHVAIDLPESARHFRVLSWMLVLLLYLAAIFCLLQGLSALRIVFHWDQWEAFFGSQLSDRAEIALYSRFWIATAVVLIFIGLWAQWRLRRRSP